MILELGKKSTKGIGRKWGLPKHQDTGFTPFCAGGESTRTLSLHHPVLVVSRPGHTQFTPSCAGGESCLLNSELLQHTTPALSASSGDKGNRVRSRGGFRLQFGLQLNWEGLTDSQTTQLAGKLCSPWLEGWPWWALSLWLLETVWGPSVPFPPAQYFLFVQYWISSLLQTSLTRISLHCWGGLSDYVWPTKNNPLPVHLDPQLHSYGQLIVPCKMKFY